MPTGGPGRKRLVPGALEQTGQGGVGLDEVWKLVEDQGRTLTTRREEGKHLPPFAEAVLGEERVATPDLHVATRRLVRKGVGPV
jgi:hypothetical protein